MVAPDDSPNRMVDACPNLQSRAVARGRARGPAYMGDIDRAIRHCVRAMQRVSSIGVRAASVTVTAGPARGEGGGTLAHSCARYGAPKDVRVYSPTFGRSRHLLRHLSRSEVRSMCPLVRCARSRSGYPYGMWYGSQTPQTTRAGGRTSGPGAGRRAAPVRRRISARARPPRRRDTDSRLRVPTGRAGPSRARPAALAECESSVTRDPRKGTPTAHTYRVGPTAASGLVPPAACRTLLDASRHQSSPAPPRDD